MNRVHSDGLPDHHRNVVRVFYGRSRTICVERVPRTFMERLAGFFGRRFYFSAVQRAMVEVRNRESVARFGEKLMVVHLDETFPEDVALATEYANRALLDLKAPQPFWDQ